MDSVKGDMGRLDCPCFSSTGKLRSFLVALAHGTHPSTSHRALGASIAHGSQNNNVAGDR